MDQFEPLCIWKSEGYRPDMSGVLKFKNLFIAYRTKNTDLIVKDWEYKVIHKMRKNLATSWETEDEVSSYQNGEPSMEEVKEQIKFMFESEEIGRAHV